MKEEKAGRDRVFVGPTGRDGTAVAVRVRPDSTMSVGCLSPVRDGVPANGRELVELSPSEDGRGYEVETLYDGRRAGSGGPAMVNSDGFRSGWDAVFGGPGRGRSAPN